MNSTKTDARQAALEVLLNIEASGNIVSCEVIRQVSRQRDILYQTLQLDYLNWKRENAS